MLSKHARDLASSTSIHHHHNSINITGSSESRPFSSGSRLTRVLPCCLRKWMPVHGQMFSGLTTEGSTKVRMSVPHSVLKVCKQAGRLGSCQYLTSFCYCTVSQMLSLYQGSRFGKRRCAVEKYGRWDVIPPYWLLAPSMNIGY